MYYTSVQYELAIEEIVYPIEDGCESRARYIQLNYIITARSSYHPILSSHVSLIIQIQ